MQIDKIPKELKARPQWVVWKYETRPGAKKPTKPLYSAHNGRLAATDNPATWSNFDDAVKAIGNGFDGIGYVIAADDPYCFIDLDSYDDSLTKEDLETHNRIANTFNSYSEISPSKGGLHLIVKGSIPFGRRRNGVEIYSSGRYMTMTGDVWRDAPILDESPLLHKLWEELAPVNAVAHNGNAALDADQSLPDEEVIIRASGAMNGEKFQHLWAGNWQLDYPSQSEADFALIDILAFYTQNRAQITRLFRRSGLGKRPKASRNQYIEYMLNKAFDNQPPEINFDALKAKFEEAKANMPTEKQGSEGSVAPVAASAPKASRTAQETPETLPAMSPHPDPFSVPPGLLGELAQYFHSTAARPVPQIALCGAMGLMAGICGRAYNVSGTGLNHYLMLLAHTGSGKEAIAEGISMLMNEVIKKVPSAADFLGPGQIQSEAALLKYLAKKSQSFVTVSGEFGQTLKKMASQHASSNDLGLKRLLLDLYAKSGKNSVLRPTIYSDSDKSTLEVRSPAFSFIGESAPEPFFESVDEKMVSDGLLPRFTIIEYSGKRPDLNEWRGCPPSAKLVQKMADLCVQALQINNANSAVQVTFEPSAKELLDSFDRECTAKINSDGIREVTRHIWNRAHLRALKLAALVSVGLNAYMPVVTYSCAQWAINLSAHNTQSLLDRFESGDVGADNTDDKQVKEVVRVVKDYLTKDWSYISKYSKDEKMYAHRIVPYSYINKRLAATSAFKFHKLGATAGLNLALKVLVDNADLTEMSKQNMFNKFGSTPRAYAISDPAAFL